MGLFTNFHFIRPAALLLLPMVVGLWWLWQRRSDPLRGWREQIAPELLASLIVGRETIKRGPALWVLVAWLLVIVAVAGPTWRLAPSPFADDATPLMVLLKADVSMDTPDPAPSRLERAHMKIADLAEARKGQPLGLIAYAGSAHLVLPPTRDTAVVTQMAGEISPAIMPVSGDRLDLALRESARVLDKGEQGGSILVVADSVKTDSAALEVLQKEFSYPIQFLFINGPESTESEAMRAVVHSFKGTLHSLRVDDRDIAAVIRRAARSPVAQIGEQGGHWQEVGYWFLPIIGLMMLNQFRHETPAQEASE